MRGIVALFGSFCAATVLWLSYEPRHVSCWSVSQSDHNSVMTSRCSASVNVWPPPPWRSGSNWTTVRWWCRLCTRTCTTRVARCPSWPPTTRRWRPQIRTAAGAPTSWTSTSSCTATATLPGPRTTSSESAGGGTPGRRGGRPVGPEWEGLLVCPEGGIVGCVYADNCLYVVCC